jgi:hypothetical protein
VLALASVFGCSASFGSFSLPLRLVAFDASPVRAILRSVS